jgi:hypothetical protein
MPDWSNGYRRLHIQGWAGSRIHHALTGLDEVRHSMNTLFADVILDPKARADLDKIERTIAMIRDRDQEKITKMERRKHNHAA